MRIMPVLIGVAFSVLIGSAAVQGQRPNGLGLLAPGEKAWFDRQPDQTKKKLIVDLRDAKACIAEFTARDGVKEAQIAAKSPQPRFYSGVSNGVVVYRTVPGIKGCSPAFLNQTDDRGFKVDDRGFKVLPEIYFGPPRSMHLQNQCAIAASRYAAAFNRTLATMRPSAFRAACPDGELTQDRNQPLS